MSGAWTIEGELDGQYIWGEYGGADVYINVEATAKGTPPTFEEHVAIEQAPLHLIAAAPQMLEALKAFVQAHSFDSVQDSPEFAGLIAALAAARGEEVLP